MGWPSRSASICSQPASCEGSSPVSLPKVATTCCRGPAAVRRDSHNVQYSQVSPKAVLRWQRRNMSSKCPPAHALTMASSALHRPKPPAIRDGGVRGSGGYRERIFCRPTGCGTWATMVGSTNSNSPMQSAWARPARPFAAVPSAAGSLRLVSASSAAQSYPSSPAFGSKSDLRVIQAMKNQCSEVI